VSTVLASIKDAPPTKRNSSTVIKILSLQEYCGDVLNFKTYSKSYKSKKRIDNDRDNWVIFKDVHDSVVDRASWERVQQKRGKIRKRKTIEGETNMFSVYLSVLTADTICITNSIRATRISSILIVPTTKVIGALAPLLITSMWTFCNRSFWGNPQAHKIREQV